jgi:hypothetical protein
VRIIKAARALKVEGRCPAVASPLTMLILIAIALASATYANADTSSSVRTQSGNTRCIVGSDVVCQYLPGFTQAPVEDPINCPPPPGTSLHCVTGIHFDLAHVTSAGAFNWNDGNIPGSEFTNDVVMSYGQTYRMRGWTISSAEDGTRFTNDASGHGMFVSIDNVSAF